jgi:hypothetical protein
VRGIRRRPYRSEWDSPFHPSLLILIPGLLSSYVLCTFSLVCRLILHDGDVDTLAAFDLVDYGDTYYIPPYSVRRHRNLSRSTCGSQELPCPLLACRRLQICEGKHEKVITDNLHHSRKKIPLSFPTHSSASLLASPFLVPLTGVGGTTRGPILLPTCPFAA